MARLFDGPPLLDKENGDIFVFSFLQPTKSRKISYREQQELLRIALEEHPDFNKDGMILDTIEKGVNFPVIHILRITEPPPPSTSTTTNNTSTTQATQNANKRTSVNLAKPLSLYEPKSVAFVEGCEHPDKHRNVQLASIKLHPTDELGADTYLMQGIFRERQRIEPEYAWSPRTNLEERAFILVGVFNLDPGYAYGLERSWRDITGARTIYHHLENEHDLCRILFLERTNKTPDIDLFAYLVLVECRCVTGQNRQKILDFVQRMRVERINMYISIYHDVDAVNPSKMGANVTVSSTMQGQFQTQMEWSGKQLSMPILSPPAQDKSCAQKSDLRKR